MALLVVRDTWHRRVKRPASLFAGPSPRPFSISLDPEEISDNSSFLIVFYRVILDL